ncbi:transposase zinc-binding domain-containing protein [Leptotrichia hongkongensis]|uniref:transposase zinc-binding domain-containing protein n=1 Tax=Leptotrichia hongkongensis TaxID=554406 RepID=UPI0035A8F13B
MTNITQNKLKYIFSNNNILLDSLKFFKKNNIRDSHLEHIKLSIDKFLACRDISKGFVKFKCPLCPITHLFPITCKSKLCPSCGYKYSMTWSDNIQKHILDIEHRHVLFTIPQECRKFFFYDRSLLSKLSAAVNQVFKFIFHNISRKRKRKNKISEHSKFYFTDSDIVHYGLISVIHTFGRDLKWNPHVHAIVSLGGFNKNLEFRKMRYFNVDTITDRLKETIDTFRKNIAVSRYSFYQRQMYKTFGMNPFYCPACKVKMIVWEFYHYRYPPLKKYY